MSSGEDPSTVQSEDVPPPPRKKFAKPPVKLACMTCRGSRVRCSGTQPCYRCTARGLACSYGQSRRGLANRRPTTRDNGVHQAGGSYPVEIAASPGNILPALYTSSEPLNFQFDETWNRDVDEIFANLFAIPSYPQAYALNVGSTSPIPANQTFHALRRYQSNNDVIEAYYNFIHPSFPILPPPEKMHDVITLVQGPQFTTPSLDVDDFFTDYQPSSPLILAVLSLLVLFPHSNDSAEMADEADRTTRYGLSQSLSECALESIEIHAYGMQEVSAIQSSMTGSNSRLHPYVPEKLEVPLAFCALSVHEYLCNGNLTKMMNLAERALDVSMQLSLHQYQEEGPDTEAIRRAWWMSYLSYCNACIVNCKVPRSIDRSNLKTPYPSSCGSQKVWEDYIRAEETLLASTLYLVALVKGFNQPSAVADFRESAALLNIIIDSQTASLCSSEGSQSPISERREDAESSSRRTLQKITRVRLASSKIKVHRYCAFMSCHKVLEKFERLSEEQSDISPSIEPSGFSWQESDGAGSSSGIPSLFPFSELDSLEVCLACALEIDTHLAAIRGDIYVPHFFCSTVQCAYTIMMVYFSLSQQRQSSWRQPVDRNSQCIQGLDSALTTLKTFSKTFNSVEKTYDLVSKVRVLLLSQ